MWVNVNEDVTIPVNIVQLVSDSDFKTIDETIAYNESGMDLNWNFLTTAGVRTQVNVVPTEDGDYDWSHAGNGMYDIEIPASEGASINNDTEGHGWFSGVADGVLPFTGPVVGFRAANLNNALINNADTELDKANVELSSVPDTTGSLRKLMQFIAAYLRNEKTVSATTETLMKEDTVTPLGTATLNKTVSLYTKGEMN
ncbi:hypothetical protein KAR10_09870 [bacterium]|nr:hypothetical protein [bacterium]